jgi:hypothetical protein
MNMKIYGENAMLALYTIQRRPAAGIPTGLCHVMEHSSIERLAGVYPGSYINDPHGVYIKMLKNAGVCMVDQYLADNPLTMEAHGYEKDDKGLNEGGAAAVLDGIEIRGPEDAARHMEQYLIPHLKERIVAFSEREAMQSLVNYESQIQTLLGGNILKCAHGNIHFPHLLYGLYGYEPYFTAYSLYPEIIEKIFSLQADYAALHNAALVKAFERAGLPKYCRLDHDMADSRGMLCSPSSLEKLWAPHFARSIKPAVDADFTLLWHCDGNLSRLVPYLLDCGINGFQGFQYEDGMDYVNICKMKPKRGGRLVIQAGVSVTRTLPFGTPGDVAREMRFLVENGTPHMLLSMSSSCVPGTPFENIRACVEGFHYYRKYGYGGKAG